MFDWFLIEPQVLPRKHTCAKSVKTNRAKAQTCCLMMNEETVVEGLDFI